MLKKLLIENVHDRNRSGREKWHDAEVIRHMQTATMPPVIILGGECNSVSVVRDLGRMGVTVYAMGESDSSVKAVPLLPLDRCRDRKWRNERILGRVPSRPRRDSSPQRCCSADVQRLHGIRCSAKHREALLEKYLLDESDPKAQQLMLDKLTTYEHGLSRRHSHAAILENLLTR